MKNAELLIGKTIEKVEELNDDEHRYWLVLTFTDGTQVKIIPDTDYSDQRAWNAIRPVTPTSPANWQYEHAAPKTES